MFRTRKLWLAVCVIGFTYLLIEIMAFTLYFALHGEAFSFAAVEKRRDEVLAVTAPIEAEAEQDIEGEFIQRRHSGMLVLHPYLGFVWRPMESKSRVRGYYTTPYGFLAEEDPLAASADPGVAIVAITGGSVSEGLFRASRELLHGYFDVLPHFKDKKVIIVMLGAKTWGQPQQLLSIAYYLAQGGRLDVLINLDGHNEIVMASDNSDYSIYPVYPFRWGSYFLANYRPDSLPVLAEATMWNKMRDVAASTQKVLWFSVSASTLWELLDTYFNRRATQAELSLRKGKNESLPYFVTGPDTMNDVTEGTVQEFVADFWMRSSMQLHHLSKANQFAYFHFLQPNQYIADSKPYTPAEIARAIDDTSYKNHALPAYYAKFTSRMPEMQRQGVNVHSLTGIYANTKETVYIDACCHLNKFGNDIMARAIGQYVTDYYNKTKPVK